ncbi:MAG: inositol-3-phosphate synthase [Desulfobacteraceae bacterium]|jgi:myo-inositol-1-phosphate synthase
MHPIKIASALIQGLCYYQSKDPQEAIGLMHWNIGGYTPWDIQVVAALDIDQRKVGLDVSRAIFSPPNCTTMFCKEVPDSGTVVQMGRVLDGVSEHMKNFDESRTFLPANLKEADQEKVVQILKASQADVLLNYLPVGSEEATRFYANCALEAGTGFVNNIPVFIASDREWAAKFATKKIPIIGDDIKSQLGATITHRVLTDLFNKRGVQLDRTYQLNTGGNTDFLNMLNQKRLSSKRKSKTEAVQSVTAHRLTANNIHIGPSDYVPWQNDNKVCFIRMEGRIFGDIPIDLELRLSVQDSPNSAGVAIDTIRCIKLAMDQKMGGVLEAPSAFFCKHPPEQYPDDEAYRMMERFIQAYSDKLTN